MYVRYLIPNLIGWVGGSDTDTVMYVDYHKNSVGVRFNINDGGAQGGWVGESVYRVILKGLAGLEHATQPEHYAIVTIA